MTRAAGGQRQPNLRRCTPSIVDAHPAAFRSLPAADAMRHEAGRQEIKLALPPHFAGLAAVFGPLAPSDAADSATIRPRGDDGMKRAAGRVSKVHGKHGHLARLPMAEPADGEGRVVPDGAAPPGVTRIFVARLRDHA